MKTYDVRITFEFPAWDEKDGIVYPGIEAESKQAAIRRVRRMSANDGHTTGGRGKYWFKATEAAASASS